MTLLPVRSLPASGQCVTDWLEHVAQDNGLPTSQLGRALRRGGGTTRFLAVKPDGQTVTTIMDLTGASRREVIAGTLSRFDGTALDLTGLDPRRWSSWRVVAARGWFHLRGTAACPACLARDGRWRTMWRLPTVTVCVAHSCYLLERCPGCGRRFADHPHEPLRRGAGTTCMNTMGQRTTCTVDVAKLAAEAAGGADRARQERHDTACAGRGMLVLGSHVSARAYLANVRHLAVLLLHLAHGAGTALAPWVEDVRREPRTGARVRWHMSPPDDSRVRSAVLATADQILRSPSVSDAADLLAPWIDAAPTGTESRLGWLADRTTMTPILTELTMAALAPHQRISTHLSRARRHVASIQVPQAVPEPLYRQHANNLFTTDKGETNRLFLSLCLARQAGASTWSDAAALLGLEGDLGVRTARSVSARSRPDPRALAEALDAIASKAAGNYRDREQRVRALSRSDAWFERWVDEHRPGTRTSSYPFAVTYLWCMYAGGLIASSPAWSQPPPGPARIAYRQFAASLRSLAASALVGVLHLEHGGVVA